MSSSSQREETRIYPKSLRVSTEYTQQSDVGKEILLGSSVNAIRDHPFEISSDPHASKVVSSVRGYIPSGGSRPSRSRYADRSGHKEMTTIQRVSTNPFDPQYQTSDKGMLDHVDLDNRKIYIPSSAERSNNIYACKDNEDAHIYSSDQQQEPSSSEVWDLKDRVLYASIPYPPPLDAIYTCRRLVTFPKWELPSTQFVKVVADNRYDGGTCVIRCDRVWDKYIHMPRSCIRAQLQDEATQVPVTQYILAATVIQRWYRKLKRQAYAIDVWESAREVIMGNTYSKDWKVQGWFCSSKQDISQSLHVLCDSNVNMNTESTMSMSNVQLSEHQIFKNLEFLRSLSVNLPYLSTGAYALWISRVQVDTHDAQCIEWMQQLHEYLPIVHEQWADEEHNTAQEQLQDVYARVCGTVTIPQSVLATLWGQLGTICPCILSQWLQACKYNEDITSCTCWVDSALSTTRAKTAVTSIPMVYKDGSVYYLHRPAYTTVIGAGAAILQGIRPNNEAKGVLKRVTTVMLKENLKPSSNMNMNTSNPPKDSNPPKERQQGYELDHIAARAIQRVYKQYKISTFQKDVASYYARRESAARSIQKVWRGYADRRVFLYMRDIITSRTLAHPAAILKLINPAEAQLLDGAGGMYVRLRLGGACFPPQIYYKLFSARPVTDIGSYAPRNYSTTNLNINTSNYIRVDNNAWRPIVQPQLLQYLNDGKKAPTSYYSKYQPHVRHTDPRIQALAAHQVPAEVAKRPYHAKKIVRQVDAMKQRKNTKLKWLKYLYGIQEGSNKEEHVNDQTYGYHVLKNQEEAPLFQAEHTFWTQVDTAVEHDDMVEWADALDYDTYAATWSVVGTTKPI